MDKDEALKQALEAFRIVRFCVPPAQRPTLEQAATKCEAALAQPAQEAVKERKNNKEWKAFDRGTRKQLKEYVSKVLQEKNT